MVKEGVKDGGGGSRGWCRREWWMVKVGVWAVICEDGKIL